MSLDPNEAVIIDYARTPMGRAKNGCFRHRRADDLSADLMNGLLARNPSIAPEAISDVLWGCVMQRGEQGFNIARNSLLRAGLPHAIPAQTVNRLCGSSMSALHAATAQIRAGMGSLYLIGGVEHMGHVDMNHEVNPNPLLSLSVAKAAGSMGLTAEYLASIHKITREDQDAFSLRSHLRAAAASNEGKFAQEIIPVMGHDSDGAPMKIEQDETIRPDTNLEGLAKLKPVFNPIDGTITAGSSSQVTDGASAMLVMSAAMAKALGVNPIAKVVSMGLVGIDPSIMGMGPVSASDFALKRAVMSLKDIDVVELNEAFAAQSLAVLKAMGLQEEMDEKVNVYGGAIALGHPFGCSGTRIVGTLLTALQERNQNVGLATMCIGLGQGIATIVERL